MNNSKSSINSNSYESEFNLRKRHPLGRFHLAFNQARSLYTRKALNACLNFSYGNSEGEKLDIFPAKSANAPVFVFIHGGYFRSLDKRQYSYMAKPLVEAGFAVAIVNYDLAPKVKVSNIVEQTIKAYGWLVTNIEKFNGNSNQFVLCGHSVGAFLTVKIIEHLQPIHQDSRISGAMLLSGLYDLSTMQQSYLNFSLNLTPEDVRALNPKSMDLIMPNTLIAVGSNETAEFLKQSADLCEQLASANSNVELVRLKNKNHYTVASMLGRRDSPLLKQAIAWAATHCQNESRA